MPPKRRLRKAAAVWQADLSDTWTVWSMHPTSSWLATKPCVMTVSSGAPKSRAAETPAATWSGANRYAIAMPTIRRTTMATTAWTLPSASGPESFALPFFWVLDFCEVDLLLEELLLWSCCAELMSSLSTLSSSSLELSWCEAADLRGGVDPSSTSSRWKSWAGFAASWPPPNSRMSSQKEHVLPCILHPEHTGTTPPQPLLQRSRVTA
mmetsp:Transcript_19487/g.51590  ORF Transcript_19487/g.51590 Transcript_19487/m.51590 type:complete len:209 (+) Transcript_19487:502-1128(+)